MLRPIKKEELRPAAEVLAESFVDYPLYEVFFPNRETRQEKMLYLFWIELYVRQKYTYVSEGLDVVISLQTPESEKTSPWGLLCRPGYLWGFVRNVPLSALLLILNFIRFETPLRKKYFDPTKDCFVPAFCIRKGARRGLQTLLQLFRENCPEQPLYGETHTPTHVRLYRMMGSELCAEETWHGCTHYVLKRPAGAAERKRGRE